MNTAHIPALLASAALLLCASAPIASAQIVTTSIVSSGYSSTGLENTGVLNLTTDGTTDWVQFGVNGTSTAFNLTNEKSGGSGGGLDTVGAVSASIDFTGGGTSTSGRTQNSSNMNVSYTDGTSPASSTANVSGSNAGIWSVQTNYGQGAFSSAALSFTITFNDAISSGNIYLATNSYTDGSTGSDFPTATLDAVLGSGDSSSQTVQTNSVNNLYDIFDISVSDIAQGDTLTLSYSLNNGAGNDNASLSGVALDLTQAPEPSTYALIGLGVIALAGLSKFRQLRC